MKSQRTCHSASFPPKDRVNKLPWQVSWLGFVPSSALPAVRPVAYLDVSPPYSSGGCYSISLYSLFRRAPPSGETHHQRSICKGSIAHCP